MTFAEVGATLVGCRPQTQNGAARLGRRHRVYAAGCIPRYLLPAECEVNAGEVFEVVLPRGVAGDVVGSKVSRQIVHFDWTELNGMRDGDVKAEAVLHRETIVAPVARGTSLL